MLGIIYRNRRILIIIITIITIYNLFKSKKINKQESNINKTSKKIEKKNFESRIIAIGDLHGDLNHTIRVLRLAGLIDLRNQWIGQSTILVQTGDIVDRGKDTILLYKLMDRLRNEASLAGGEVINLLGNHEYMNALGDWRYVTKEDIETFGSAENRRKVISTKGWIGKAWISNYSVTARVPYGLKFNQLPEISKQTSTNKLFFESFKIQEEEKEKDEFLRVASLFVHGGITPQYAKKGITEINKIGKSLLIRALNGKIPFNHLPPNTPIEEIHLYSENGPLWERSFALEKNETIICKKIDQVINLLNVRRMIMGHTPQFKGITSRCGGKILLIDTGISSAYGGPLSALEINYSLNLIHESNHCFTWNEIESIFSLQELKSNKQKILISQRSFNLTKT